MEIREMISESLAENYRRYKMLKELVDNTSDQELDKILDFHFIEYTYNIGANFTFLQMIISRVNEDEYFETGRKTLMNNEELEEYFKENWDFLISDCC